MAVAAVQFELEVSVEGVVLALPVQTLGLRREVVLLTRSERRFRHGFF